ncbi:MAG TPA: hypothetical protein EYQ83_20805 [Acidobacteria bacterium]|jgi:hypothetical protein|nr:hypothetical protein [Acidobacteriota bacterium]
MRQRTCVSAAMFTILVRLGVTLLMIGVTVADRAQGAEPNAVRQLPDGHIQPMARVDASGTVHLIYFTGDPVAGDVYYVRRTVDAVDFSIPLRVNS